MMDWKKFFAKAYIWLLLIVLYAPILFIVIFSFTEAKSLGNWTGFSTALYHNLFTGSMQNASGLLSAVENTLLIALVASVVATILGTVAAIGMFNLHGRKKGTMNFLNNIPMINPDIITGVSLFLLFVFLGISQGYVTVILAHITFCTPYVVLNVMPKLRQMDPNIYEAALDLGATPMQALRKVMMPLLLIMALGISIFVLTQPGAVEGAAYYLIPDFSKFSPELVINALGQMFYSLSLAMGIMVTYGSYLDKKESLTQSVVGIAGFDLVVSFLSGLIIVPAAFMALGLADGGTMSAGPSLMFVTLPGVFAGMGEAAGIIGTVFFMLVLFAAMTSAISFFEGITSIVQDGLHWSRGKSLALVSAFIVIVGCFINAGYNALSWIEPLGPGTQLLDFFDFVSNSVIMPIVALLTCIFIGWVVKPKAIIDEVRESSPFKSAGIWTVIIKYIAPVLIAVILITNVIS